MAVQRLSNSGRSGFSYKSLIAGITPLPSVPTIGAATAVNFESVNVAFTAPGAYAGSTYTATSSPGGLTGTSASSPILVEGLSELTEYTFTVTATNATGTSGASAASSPVTTPSGDMGVMFPIQMVSVGAAGASTISFTSIPSTYKHLQVRISAKNTRTGENSASVFFQINSDTSTSNYTTHYLRGDGSTRSSFGAATGSYTGLSGESPSADLTSNLGVMIYDFIDYTNTNKYKTIRSINGYDANGSGSIYLSSNLWLNANAISTIQFTVPGYSWAQNSKFALYGIKGA